MFRTELPLTPHPQQLPHSARVLTLGSCFSDSIGSRLRDFKVAAMVNPFGTVFNPISVCKLLRAAAGEDMDWQQHVVEARGRWQSYDLHAEVGADSPVELLQNIQTLTREVGVFLATADAVVLTLGSAYAYRLRETDEIISNCHKVAADKFSKELLTADDIIAAVAETHAYLRRINPRLRFILTVSPVRHIKDTLVLNSASKSMLRVACHYLSELLPDVSYFPAYELLLDDLRDYRFYASDMLHPSDVAENYIWERFTRTYFDAAFGRFKKEWEGIRQALGHRPLYAAAPEHRQFLESTLERLRRLSSVVDVRMELLHLERELAALPLPPPPPVEEPEEFDDEEERIDIGEPEEETALPEASARLVTRGSGVLVEPEQDEDAEPEEAIISSESAYEHAYSAALAEEDDENDSAEAEEAAPETGEEEPVRKKKRRSRGGAKRTKRKHARLAAEAAAQEGITTEVPAPEAPEQELATPESTADVVYITEAELRGGRPEIPTPEEDPKPLGDTTDAAETTPEEPVRRNRNRRRDAREERPTRAGGRNARKPLYASAEETPAEAVAPEEVSVSVPEVLATPEVTPEAPTNEQPIAVLPAIPVEPTPAITPELPEVPTASPEEPTPTSRKQSRSKPAAERAPRPSRRKKPEPASAELPAVAEEAIAPASDIPATAPETKPAKAAAKPRNRRKAPEAEATPTEVTPTEPAAPAPTARKRAPKRPAVETPIAPAEARPPAEPETTPEPPKRRARPPRRKPAADAPAPETT
ncbi:GSCFA domain-containing protein [Hymenobacter sediminis]|uniref:GSCFA domain-containing protein n=1 Tax=Hymenobacter sediminis TaxID=2218621 RepID=UPI00138FE958|nr:GSCFA domain-containing protein [Hymenobacter sediminis]